MNEDIMFSSYLGVWMTKYRGPRQHPIEPMENFVVQLYIMIGQFSVGKYKMKELVRIESGSAFIKIANSSFTKNGIKTDTKLLLFHWRSNLLSKTVKQLMSQRIVLKWCWCKAVVCKLRIKSQQTCGLKCN